eukprot:gnl/TRDRNA2_/TRDRNA2_164835_c0_seq1.p1 gnl/TRDRNA2_/TRDRNA2_164835_c0~~gnl/TRDRNA2_/TRDRNA2_164835_c0_seq1.p1  ORF type:complete len:629 (-),score=68.68 gnl/TRDRNA2_/TRDRNA2_164835_c0_seq1:344-2098(-)
MVVVGVIHTETETPLPAPPESSLVADPISITLIHGNGTRIKGALKTPLLFRVSAVPANGSVTCVFWDEDLETWSDRGLWLVEHSESKGLVCATTHLSLFNVIAEEFEKTIRCSHAKVLSEEGLLALTHGSWWQRPAALFIWVLLALQVSLLVCTSIHHGRTCQDLGWKVEDFLSEDPIHKEKKKKGMLTAMILEVEHIMHIKQQGQPEADEKQAAESAQTSTPKIAAQRAISFMDQNIIAHHEKIHPKDVKYLKRKVCIGLLEQSRSVPDYLQGAAVETKLAARMLDNSSGALQKYFFISSCIGGFFYRMVIVFGACHPWLALDQFSMIVPAPVRVLLLSSKVFGALMLSAFFFEASGQATSDISPEECKKSGDLLRNLVQNVIVACFSMLLSTVPLFVIQMLQMRHFQYRETWGVHEKHQQLFVWKMKLTAVWICGISYSLFCMFFIILFIANVAEMVANDWLQTAGFAMFKEFILVPLGIAFGFSVLASWLLFCHPQIVQDHATAGLSGSNSQRQAATSLKNEVSGSTPDESSITICIQTDALPKIGIEGLTHGRSQAHLTAVPDLQSRIDVMVDDDDCGRV